MKEKLRFKPNRRVIGISIVLLTIIYLVVSTVFAQSETKKAETGIEYKKDHLSYGDVWAFDSAAHTASYYSKANLGTSSYYSNSSTTNNGTTNFTRFFYKEVTTTTRGEPTGTTVPSHALTRFVNGTLTQEEIPSPVDENLKIPVMATTTTNNTVRYSVVPDSKGTYYVYVYSENGEPTVNYAMLDSPDASIAYNEVSGLPDTALEFEEVGNNWYRASIEVKTVRWHAVSLNDPKNSGSSNSPSGEGTYYGGQDFDTELTTTTYYYNKWTTTNVDYNTVLVFQFTSAAKLGPITKAGDTITINNPDTAKGDVTAYTVFGDEIAIGEAVEIPHCPVIISGKGNGDYILDEVNVEKGSGQINASGSNYVYPFEDTSEISVSWTKLVNLPSISVTGGTSDFNMDFFAAKRAEIIHPANTERVYTFTADFDGADHLDTLTYSYTFNGSEQGSGTLTQSNNSFSVSDVCYKTVVVTFTATDIEGDKFTATCTINLSAIDATAPFKVVDDYYLTWEEAVTAANGQNNANNKRVILNANYTLPSDLHGNGMLEDGTYVTVDNGRVNYDLPSGVVFIVPYAESFNYNNISDHPYACELQKQDGHWGYPVAIQTSVYVELTVPSNCSIQIENNATVSVGGATEGACVMYAEHGNIHLEDGAQINVEKGGRLSAVGYVYGDGTVNALDGSTVYMPFSALDFRGGGYTVGVGGRLDSNYGISNHPSGEKGLSPFLRYTMNGIQSKLVVNQGAQVVGYIDLAASNEHHNAYETIIGSGDALIKMIDAKIEITYDANTYASTYSTVGKTTIKIDGDAEFGNLEMTIKVSVSFISASATINTSKINFPIPYNYDIEIASGTFTVPNSIMLLPGAKVTVDESATLDVKASLTIYDGLHDYTSSGTSEGSNAVLSGWEKGSGNPDSQSTYTSTINTYDLYPSTAVLQGATFGGSGSADLIVNGTLNLRSSAKVGGIIQTGSSGAARIITESGIETSTKTQIGAAGVSSAIGSSYFAGATVRTLTGEILDTATGNRTTIVGDQTYYPSAGAGNISSYTYTLYYDSSQKYITLTDEVACILQGSWWNYAVQVYTVALDGTVSSEPTMMLYFAHGADASDLFLTTDEDGNIPAKTITSDAPLYFNVKNAEAMIVWANGDEPTYYPIVRNAVQAAVNKGDRIVLLKDLTDFSSVIGPHADQDFIFDMDGNSIYYRSTPFVSTSGGKMTVYVGKEGKITNVVNGKHYDSPVLMVTEGSTLYLYLDGGSISVTGDENTQLVNGGVENSGTLYIDLGGGTWEYKTGLVVPKSNVAANQHHDLTVMAPYQSKAMFNNMGTLTIKDSVGGGTITTDLISNGTTLTAATPTSNYVSVIRNNAGATLYLGGGTLILEPHGDEDGDAILSTAATPIPMAVYSAVILNFGDIQACDGTALSMQGSGGYLLYNFIGGTVDLDLRGGTLELKPYDKGVEKNPAMYSGKAAVVNDGTMILQDSTRKGLILVNLTSTSGNIYGIYNNTNSAFNAVLTLDGINIQAKKHTLNNNCYGVYNGPGGTITSIKDCKIEVENGQALRNYGNNTNAALKAKIGDITGSTFISGGAAVAANGVVGSHALHNYYGELGNITNSTFKSAGASALYNEASATIPISIGDITGSNFTGVVYGFYTTYTTIGKISNSNFTGGTNYAMSVGTNSTIKSITGGKFATNKNLPDGLVVSTNSGGLNMAGTAENKTNGTKRVLATIGGITGAEFDVYQVGINISHADIGDLDHVIIKTQNGNGITASNGSIIGDITGCNITSGVYSEAEGKFTSGAAAISSDGTAASATADLLIGRIGNISDSILTGSTYGITSANGSIIGDITGCEIHSGSNYAISIGGRAANAALNPVVPAVAPVIGNISGTTITSLTGGGISAAGQGENKNTPQERVLAVIGDISKTDITVATIGMNLSHTEIGDLDYVTITTQTGNGITATNGCIIGCIVDCEITSGVYDEATGTFTTGGVGLSTAGAAPTATADVLVPKVGSIIRSKFYARTQGISIAGQAANATYGTDIAYALLGDITKSTFVTGNQGISISYCHMGKIEGCELTAVSLANTTGAIQLASYSYVEAITDTDITIKATTTGTTCAGIYNANSTIGDIESGSITAEKGYGINAAGTAENKSTNVARVLAVFGDITGMTIDAQSIGVNISHTEIGDLDHVIITTETGNGINSANGSVIGDITDCKITSGVFDEETGKFTTGGIAISSDGAAATATADLLIGQIGNITDTVLKGRTGGISNANGSVIGDIIGDKTVTIIQSDAYGINMTSRAGNAYAEGAAPSIGNLTKVTINAGTYGIASAGAAAATANLTVGDETVAVYRDGVAPTIGDMIEVTINAGTYCFSSAGVAPNANGKGAAAKVGKIEDCEFNSVTPANNTYVINNTNGSIEYIKDSKIRTTSPTYKVNAINNVGSQIGYIEGCEIDAPYGIYNANTRGDTYTAENGSTIAFYGKIGSIKDTNITVAQYAIRNYGVIDEIVGECTFIASNPSAQVPWDYGNIAASNAAANTVVNYNGWWGTDTVWKRTDTYDSEGHLIRTDEYKWDDEFRPTIGKISGDIKIIAENTGNAAGHGYALTNNGVIREISGNVVIETYVHPDNAAVAYSSYALNNVGGRIDKITGNVKISAGSHAISNTQGTNLFIKNVTTYTNDTATTAAAYEREYYADFGIGDISGEIVIEATENNYAILNNGRIGNITGKVSITADKGTYAIYNQTTTAYVHNNLLWPGQSTAVGATKKYHEEYVVARIGTIGSDDSEILIRSASGANNNYTIYNNGTIEAIINATIETTVGYNNMPTIMNTGDAVRVKDQQYKNLGLNETNNWYDLAITRDYAYVRPTIGEIRGVTVKTPQNYALRNAGYIKSITESSFTAGTGYGIDNTSANNQIDGAEYARTTVQYYHSNALDAATAGTPFATTTQYFGETAIWYTRSSAEIGKIDNVTITVESGNYGIQNAGIIGSITNSRIEMLSGNYAIGNSVRTTTGEDVRMMADYVYQKDDGTFALRAAGEITDKVWYYAVPRIDSIGAGNTISAVSQTIYNMGYIGEIGSETGERTTITATGDTANGTQYAIYNYQGLTSKVERLGQTTDTNTYTGAEIGIIQNVSINSQNSYAIYNIGAANTYHAVIGEIAEGTEVTSVSKDTVYNHATNAEIKKITGGIFTTGEGAFYAIYNNSTTFPIAISGGYFKGGSGDRANAIYDNVTATRYTYPSGAALSKGTKSVTFADGKDGIDYYFIAVELTIHFDGNGGTGEMESLEIVIDLSDPEDIPSLKNEFSPLEGFFFQGWSNEDYDSEPQLRDRWSGTFEELQDLLGREIRSGDEITLYAIWDTEERITIVITWGDMDFTYTEPYYVWDPNTTTYVLTNPNEAGWRPTVGTTNTIKISVIGSGEYIAKLSFTSGTGYDQLEMSFTDENDEALENDTVIVNENEETIIHAMLGGSPEGVLSETTTVGTVKIELTANNP